MDQMEMRGMFVGQNSEYYINQWETDGKNGSKVWVNKAAFSIFWFFYRKMYLIGLGVLVGVLILPFALQIILTSAGIPELISINIGRFITLGLWVFVGIKANPIYMAHVDRKIARIKETNRDNPDAALKRAGGVTAAGVLIPIAILLGFAFLLIWLLSMLVKMI